jgi:hypothetical protein
MSTLSKNQFCFYNLGEINCHCQLFSLLNMGRDSMKTGDVNSSQDNSDDEVVILKSQTILKIAEGDEYDKVEGYKDENRMKEGMIEGNQSADDDEEEKWSQEDENENELEGNTSTGSERDGNNDEGQDEHNTERAFSQGGESDVTSMSASIISFSFLIAILQGPTSNV